MFRVSLYNHYEAEQPLTLRGHFTFSICTVIKSVCVVRVMSAILKQKLKIDEAGQSGSRLKSPLGRLRQEMVNCTPASLDCRDSSVYVSVSTCEFRS